MSLATVSIDKAETDAKKNDMINGNPDDLEDDEKQEDLKKKAKVKDLKEIWTIFEPKKLPFWEN